MARGDNHSGRNSGKQNDLRSTLTGLDSSGYGGYKRLRGTHRLTAPSGTPVTLSVDKVQSDPFAPPSLIQVSVPLSATGIAADLLTPDIPVRDHLTRRVDASLRSYNPGGGKGSGFLTVDAPGHQVLDRSSVIIDGTGDRATVTVRLEAALPAQGRRIRGRAAATLLCDVLPQVVQDALLDLDASDLDALAEACELYRDQEALRAQLDRAGLVGFVADGSVLPRAAGNSQRPLPDAVPFEAPESLRSTVELPSGRTVTGLGVPKGVTLIVGGGYHGKSTLLKALELGIYNHIGGDGREFAVTDADAVSLRAEDGRAVTGVDISAFLHDLPGQSGGTNTADTTDFSTTNASGSTSQAAGLVEACEAGASCLLIDEDTSATNFLVRDARMRVLVPAGKEPITPLVDRARALYRDHGVSTVLVAGGSGAFLDVADTVIMLDAYHPVDVTAQARDLAEPVAESASFPMPGGRTPRVGQTRKPPQAKERDTIRHGDGELDLSACVQLVDTSQTRAIAALLPLLDKTPGTLVEKARTLHDRIRDDSWEVLPRATGSLALPRVQEITAAVNRLR